MAASSVSESEAKVPFGRAMREAQFGFAPHYTPLNHGSYGTYPLSVAKARNALLAEVEQAPDPFIGLSLSPSPSPSTITSTANSFPSSYTSFYHRLSESRALTANILNCALDEVVFVPNATTGVDTVLKNIRWERGDVILVYEVVYEAVYKGLEWLVDTFGVRVEVVRIAFPESDDGIVGRMVDAARRVNSASNSNINTNEGEEEEVTERVRLAIIDTIVSMPGLRIPFEKLVPALQAEGAMVLVDAAHGIGQIPIDLEELRPDFLVTNLHKWFFVPRGCAALYVPKRNQGLIRTSLPTSVRYRGEIDGGKKERENAFVELFDFVASVDNTNWLTVKAAIDFRNEICGGEEAIQIYSKAVALQGAEAAAEILGTEIMSTEGSCMLDCALINVRLPLEVADPSTVSKDATSAGVAIAVAGAGASNREREKGKINPAHGAKIVLWIKETGIKESGCYIQTCLYRGAFWWRLSGMIYVDVDDFRRGAEVLKGLCERIREGGYLA